MGTLISDIMPVGPLETNCYFLADSETREALIIDPGCEAGEILAMIEARKWQISTILLTHGHYDHIGALEPVRKKTGAKVLIHSSDGEMLINPELNGSALWGVPLQCEMADASIQHEDRVDFAGRQLRVIHTPGHSPGSCSFLIENLLFSGDTLFYRSVGRSDLWGGSTDQLMASIKNRLFVLNDSIQVFPGHGSMTTIQEEKTENPFLAGHSAQI